MLNRKYVVRLIIENGKDAELVALKEGYANVDIQEINNVCDSGHFLMLTIKKKRRYLSALMRCIGYFKRYIYCTIVKVND